jgi:hypothetical protein
MDVVAGRGADIGQFQWIKCSTAARSDPGGYRERAACGGGACR